VASLGGRTAPGDTIQGRVTPEYNYFFLWLNLERTPLDKRRGKMGVVRKRQLLTTAVALLNDHNNTIYFMGIWLWLLRTV